FSGPGWASRCRRSAGGGRRPASGFRSGPPMRTRPPPASRRASPAASASRGRAPGRGSSGPAVVAVGGAQVVPLRSLAVAAGEFPPGVVGVEVVDGGAVDLVGGQLACCVRCRGVVV